MDPSLLYKSLMAGACITYSFASFAETDTERSLINNAVSAIDVCSHWAGELGDQSEERNKEIERGINTDCPKATALAQQAFHQYPNSPRLYEPILTLADLGHFELSPDEKRRVCRSVKANPLCKE